MEVPCAIKKKPGKLIQSGNQIKWVSNLDGTSETLELSDIQGMQATPPTAAKMRIKLSAKDGRALMLEFSGATDLETARNGLQAAIKTYREQSNATAESNTSSNQATPGTDNTASQPPAQANITPGPKKGFKKISLEPPKLLQNLDLQRSVLRQDPELMQMFQQVVISSGALTNEQFWSLRIHLLVTAAQQQLQARGSYNVLSTIKPTIGSDNRVNINLTREKIADVFDQYPLVRKAYNENVPKLSEGEFWQRFFMSKLFLVLRGEKVTQNHIADAIFDPYIDILYELQEKQRSKRAMEDSEHPAPVFINVEANAENNPETYGNNTLTTAGKGTRGLIRSMNSLSYRLLLGKRKQREIEAAQLAGPDAMESELKLNDLANTPSKYHEIDLDLHIQNLEASKVSREHLARMSTDITQQTPKFIALDAALDSIHDGSSQSEIFIDALTPHKDATHVGSEIHVGHEVQLTQATSLEFLRHFWNAYSKSPAEAAPLREYLIKSKERIDALSGAGSQRALQSVIESINRALALPV